MNYLDFVVAAQKNNLAYGVTSICSSHPFVLETALQDAKIQNNFILIEATCNQVNQFGGYTGMTPIQYVQYIEEIVRNTSIPPDRVLLGGDHLGPLVWSNEPAEQAMNKAKKLVHDYVSSGFKKIHLDCSMSCVGEQELPLQVIAQRTAELAKVSEDVCQSLQMEPDEFPRYVIGSEVPTAGGSQAGEYKHHITNPADAREMIETSHRAFMTFGLDSAWERVMALVVEPGVEFGDDVIYEYDRSNAVELTRFIESVPGFTYEAHSTDYQTRSKLQEMVEDHFSILKVGPALTYAYREVVFALAEIDKILHEKDSSNIRQALENAMLAKPVHWQRHYGGSPKNQKISRSYSFSDRIRYYWNVPTVEKAISQMIHNLGTKPLPLSILSQYLPSQYKKIREGLLNNSVHEIIKSQVIDVLADYQYACSGSHPSSD